MVNLYIAPGGDNQKLSPPTHLRSIEVQRAGILKLMNKEKSTLNYLLFVTVPHTQ